MYLSGNKLLYWEHLARYLRGEKVIPITWELDLTTACNQDCPNCSGNRRAEHTLKSVEATELVERVRDAGGKGLILTGGGEPTMNRGGLFAVLGILPTLLFTNGELFDEALACKVLPKLKGIRFSLDAYDYLTAERWRGISSNRWDMVVSNLKHVCELKRDMLLSATVGSGYLTDASRISGIPLFADISACCGVDYAQCRPILWTMKQQQVPDWQHETYRSMFDRVKAKYPCLTESFHKYELMAKGEVERIYEKCHAGRFASTIGADAKLYFCCHTRYMPDFCLGDLRKQSIEDIFQSGRVEEIRDNMSFECCPLLCRGDAINRGIQALLDGKPDHLEFL